MCLSKVCNSSQSVGPKMYVKITDPRRQSDPYKDKSGAPGRLSSPCLKDNRVKQTNLQLHVDLLSDLAKL